MVSLPMVCTAGPDLNNCPAARICYSRGANRPQMEAVSDDNPNAGVVAWDHDRNAFVFSVRMSHFTSDPALLCGAMRSMASDPLELMGYRDFPPPFVVSFAPSSSS